MNKLLTVSLILNLFFFKAQTAFDFTIHVVSPSNSITCLNSSVDFVISNDSDPNLICNWVSQTAFYFGTHVSINIPGTYTVTVTNINAASATKTINIATNFTAPPSSLSALTQSINCSGSVTGTITATSSQQYNISHKFISPYGGTYIDNTTSATFKPTAPGTYTYILLNTINGCSTVKTFTIVQSGTGLPTFNLASSGNYSLGCASASNLTISINNAQTTPIPAGPVSYTVISPSSSTILPSGNLSNISQYMLNSPGQYTAVTRDNTTGCETRVPFTITQNNLNPNLTLLIPNYILDCRNPKLKLEAISSNAYINYEWFNLQNLNSTQSNTFMVSSNASVSAPTLHSTYTISATGYENLCSTSSVVTIYQNTYKPIVAVSSTHSLTLSCITPSIILTNLSSSSIPSLSPFSSAMPVVATWCGQTSSSITANSCTIAAPALYTVTVTDKNNGCSTNSVIPILDGKQYPQVNYPAGPIPFCINTHSNSVVISPILGGPIHRYSFKWIAPGGFNVNGSNYPSINANSIGVYTVFVTNTVSGCTTQGDIIVRDCYTGLSETSEEISLRVYPNPTNNYVTIALETPNTDFNLKIYNILGELIQEKELREANNLIDLSNQLNGIYSLVVLKNYQIVYSSKLLKN
jgi:hypothetical protein